MRVHSQSYFIHTEDMMCGSRAVHVLYSPEHEKSMVVSICRHPASSGRLRLWPVVQEALYSLRSVGTKERLKCSVQQPGRRCFVAGSAHTAGGGTFVIWCETSGSGFASDDTHSPLCTSWQTLNNTQKNLWHI